MSAPLKIISALFGLIIFLLLAAVVLVPLFVDPNEYKSEIVTEVKKATGRDLTINGDISLSLFPWLGLELGELYLSNATGFGDKPFVSLDHSQVRVKLLPLLSKQVVVDTVIVDGLRLNLAKNAAGISNWDDLVQGGESTDDKQGGHTVVHKTEDTAGLKALAIEGIAINDAHLVWDDRSSGQRYEIKGVNLESGEISLGQPTNLTLSFTVLSEQPALTADLLLKGEITADTTTQKYQIKGLTLNADLQGEMLPEAGLQAELLAVLTLDQRADAVDVKSLTLTAADLRLTGSLFGRSLSTTPLFEGELKLAEFKPRMLLKKLALPLPEMADPSAFNKLALKTDFRADTKNLTLEKLVFTLDQSHIEGHFKLLDFNQPAYRFKLKLDEIDVDRYLPPTPVETDEQQSEPSTAATTENAELIPVEMMRSLNIEGEFGIGKLKAKNIRAQFIDLDIHAKDGQLSVDQRVKRFYDGTINGRIGLDVRGKLPRITIEEHAQKIQAEPLVSDVAGQDRLSGVGRFNANLTTSGQSVMQFKERLAGKVNFTFNNGAVKGVNVAQMLREAKAKMGGKKLPPNRREEKTDFSELSASAVIEQGLLSSRDLLMKSPFLRITGKGKVDLVAENLDYLLRPVIVTSDKGQGGEGLDDLVGVPIPIQLTGSWSEPDWKVNLEEVLLNSQKAKAEKSLKKEIEKVLPKELGEDPGKLLKKLF